MASEFADAACIGFAAERYVLLVVDMSGTVTVCFSQDP